MFARILTLLFLLTSFFLAPSVYAQTAASVSALPAAINPASPLYTDLIVHNLFHTFSCISIGQSLLGQPCLNYQITKNAEGLIQTVPVLANTNFSGGALGVVTGAIGAIYRNPPISSTNYLASVGQNIGLVKQAHAQVTGSGQGVLDPIMTLWQVSRNISYGLIIIIFLVIGLMIIFRNKINPQTVISAQAALPGLIIGLIMITFSYFFAGLISDMAFVGTNIVGYYFSIAQRPTTAPVQDVMSSLKEENALSLTSPFTGILNQENVSNALDSIWPYLERKNRQEWNPLDLDPSRVITILVGFMISQILMPWGSLVPGIGQIIAGGISFGAAAINPVEMASFGLAFIGMLILIYAMLRLLLRLINNYLTIIILTITAPFQFLAAALPGRQGIATGWIMNMLANVLAFPAVFAVLYFVAYLVGQNYVEEYFKCGSQSQGVRKECVFNISKRNGVQYNALVPEALAADSGIIVDEKSFPLFGGLDLSFLRLLLAFAALVAVPSIPDLIGKTIGRMSQAGQLIGQEISGGVSAGQRYAGQFQQGVSGIPGQLGRVTDEPGWILGQNGWEKVTRTSGHSTDQAKMSGVRPGLGSRIKFR